MLRQLAGSSLGEEDLQELVEMVLVKAECPSGMDIKAFKAALSDADLEKMVVEVPIDR